MKLNGRVVGLSFLVTLALSALAYALTSSEVWQSVYDSSNTAIRVNIIAGS
jgi:hypothetical protein